MSSPSSELNHLIVRAGAGAGKTTDLVRLVLSVEDEFWHQYKRHAKIVVTTFTRKATQELKERLLSQAIEQQKDYAIDFVQKPSQLHISTIHGVLSLFLTRYGSALGLSSQMQIISKKKHLKISKKILRDIMNPTFAQLLEFRDLNLLINDLDKYYQAWCLGHLKRITDHDLKRIHLQRISELVPQLEKLIECIGSEDCPDSWIEYQGHLVDLVKKLRIKADFDLLKNFCENVKSPAKTKNRPSLDLSDFKKEVQSQIEELCRENCSHEYFQNHENLTQLFDSLGSLYSQRLFQIKIENSLLSLQDLELFSMRLIQFSPQSALNFSKEWDYWMIDEYQDTSPLQVALIKELKGTSPEYIVGDPQQSIYLFRGARSEVFLAKEQEIPSTKKMTNYRSRPELLEYFNDIFSRFKSRQFMPMSSEYKKDLPIVEQEVAQLFFVESAEDEIKAAFYRAHELICKNVSPEKICILARSNEELKNLALMGQSLKLPIQVHSGNQFSQRSEVIDALSLLKFLVNPHDNINFIQLLRCPWMKLNDQLLLELPGNGVVSYYLAACEKKSGDWSVVKTLDSYLQLASQIGYVDAWIQALVQLKIIDSALELDSSGRAEANLWKLVSLIKHNERKPGFSILEFLEELVDIQVENEGDSDATPVIEPKRINIMTVHASKGLQFDHVILLGLGKKVSQSKTEFFMMSEDTGEWSFSLPGNEDQKLVPSLWTVDFLNDKKSRENLESERVFYVALTRAILGVTLISSKVAEGSWLQKLNIFLDDKIDGQVIHDQNYSYQIRKPQSLEINGAVTAEKNKLKIRDLYQAELSPDSATTSVTEMIRSEGIQLSTASLLKSLQRAKIGVDLHSIFESLKYSCDLVGLSAESTRAVQFIRSWNQGQIEQIIRNGFVEWGFAIKSNTELLQGQIDLWGHDDQHNMYIVDYKTGSSVYLEKAFQQLEIYAEALFRMKKVTKDIKLMVVYPFEEKVIIRESKLKEQLA